MIYWWEKWPILVRLRKIHFQRFQRFRSRPLQEINCQSKHNRVHALYLWRSRVSDCWSILRIWIVTVQTLPGQSISSLPSPQSSSPSHTHSWSIHLPLVQINSHLLHTHPASSVPSSQSGMTSHCQEPGIHSELLSHMNSSRRGQVTIWTRKNEAHLYFTFKA